jgi:simple sugar transport system substrate-binding protein
MKKFLVIALLAFIGCAKQPQNRESENLSILVYITGVTAGSPTYEMLAEGALYFAENNGNVTVKIYEAGFNQAEWEGQLNDLVSSGEYDIVLGSNPSLPEICENVGRRFPDQKFIILDAFYDGNSQISTYLYNQYEQSLYLGYLAGLVASSDMQYANNKKRIGFIAAQEYPLLTKQMVPGFLDGARLVDQEFELDKRIIGNWFDGNKAAELASSMIDSGVSVFTSIAGGASQGMVKTAVDRGAYVVWYNTNEYSQAPGIIIGCGIMEQKKLVIEILNDVLAGNIQYGNARTVGVREGYLGFAGDDPGFLNYVPAHIREAFNNFLQNIRNGNVNYTVPPL